MNHAQNSERSSSDSANAAANVAYLYDELGRVSSETSNGLTHTFQHDLAGNLTSATFAEGADGECTATYVPDALNRLRKITTTGLTPAMEVAME